MSVRLYYIDGNDIIDCGCIESAARLGCDSNPVPQTNLGLTSLYSLISLLNRTDGLLGTSVGAVLLLFKRRTCRGVGIGSTLVAYHFF